MSCSKDIQTSSDSQKAAPIEVPKGTTPARLDAFLRRYFTHVSRRQTQAAIEAGEVLVNGRKEKKGRILFPGDVVSFTGYSVWREKAPLPNSQLRVEILYEDEALLVLDKPAGMSCHGFSSRESRSLANFLLAHHPFLNGVGESVWEAGLVHRLDRDTSGVALAVKDREAYLNLRGQFRRQTVRKRYLALVWGLTAQREMLSWPLAHDPKDRRRMMVLQNPAKENFSGKRWKAVTRFKTLCRRRSFSYLEIELLTGVTHQIRAHLEAAGYPLVGDRLYCGDAPPSTLGRQFLHASSLEISHPWKGSRVTFESALPEELRKALDEIGIPSS